MSSIFNRYSIFTETLFVIDSKQQNGFSSVSTKKKIGLVNFGLVKNMVFVDLTKTRFWSILGNYVIMPQKDCMEHRVMCKNILCIH